MSWGSPPLRCTRPAPDVRVPSPDDSVDAFSSLSDEVHRARAFRRGVGPLPVALFRMRSLAARRSAPCGLPALLDRPLGTARRSVSPLRDPASAFRRRCRGEPMLLALCRSTAPPRLGGRGGHVRRACAPIPAAREVRRPARDPARPRCSARGHGRDLPHLRWSGRRRAGPVVTALALAPRVRARDGARATGRPSNRSDARPSRAPQTRLGRTGRQDAERRGALVPRATRHPRRRDRQRSTRSVDRRRPDHRRDLGRVRGSPQGGRSRRDSSRRLGADAGAIRPL